MSVKETAPTLFFDGDCRFCHRSVEFVLAKEQRPELRFSWLKSEYAAKHIPKAAPDSLVLMEDGVLYYRSSAALRLCAYLRSPYRWLQYLRIVPSPIRDKCYDLISAYRKKIMGSASCTLPIGKEDRFL